MKQSTDFIDSDYPDHVLLLRTLYGLKQSPQAWFSKLSSYLLQLGFFRPKSDSSMFIFINGNTMIILLIYVDDILVTAVILSLFTILCMVLIISLLSKILETCLSFLVFRFSASLQLYIFLKLKYIHDLLARANMSGYKPIHSPIAF